MEDNNGSKLCYSLKISPWIKDIDLRHFFHLSITLENCICWYYRFWILESLYLVLMEAIHDQVASGHLGHQKTISFLARNHYWQIIKEMLHWYIQNCHAYRRTKASRNWYDNLLNSLLISTEFWIDIIFFLHNYHKVMITMWY